MMSGMNVAKEELQSQEQGKRITNFSGKKVELVCSSEIGGMINGLVQEISQETID